MIIPGTEHHTARVNGIRLHFVTAGDGPPVLLLHGFPETWFAWRHQIPALAGRYRVIAPGPPRLRRDGEAGGRLRQADDGPRHPRVDAASRHREGGRRRPRPRRPRRHPVRQGPSRGHRPPGGHGQHPHARSSSSGWTPKVARGHWFFIFNNVPDLPEALIAGREEIWLRYIFSHWCYNPELFTPEEMAVYVAAYSQPGALRGAFNDYRAGRGGRRPGRGGQGPLIACPTLALWGEEFELGRQDVGLPRGLDGDGRAGRVRLDPAVRPPAARGEARGGEPRIAPVPRALAGHPGARRRGPGIAIDGQISNARSRSIHTLGSQETAENSLTPSRPACITFLTLNKYTVRGREARAGTNPKGRRGSMPRPLGEQTIVITGASSGFGREAAILFGRRGANVVLAARDEAALREVAAEIERAGGQALRRADRRGRLAAGRAAGRARRSSGSGGSTPGSTTRGSASAGRSRSWTSTRSSGSSGST